MDFVDRVLVRLATPATRAALFDEEALRQLVATGYDADALGAAGPYSPVFDTIELGLSLPSQQVIEGRWRRSGSSEHTEARFDVQSPAAADRVGVEALWRGSIAVRVTPGASRVVGVAAARPVIAGVDAEIIAALGALPADPAVLEQQRRTRIATRVKALMDEPDALDDAELDRWIASLGLGSAGELVERSAEGVVQSSALRVTFSPAVAGPPITRGLPVTVALLVREAGFSVAELLGQSKAVRDRIVALGARRASDPSLPLRQAVVVAWVMPATVFDDDDWPGPNAAARRSTAGSWLNPQGIALVTAA